MNTIATPITWGHLLEVKKMAKTAKATFPNLSHAQRLDAIAKHLFGVRHFHELKQHYAAQVASHVVLDGSHHCRFCHLNFSDYDADDRKLHSERHQCFEEVQSALGFLPQAYKVGDKMKRDFGYEQLYHGDANAKRVGALAIMLSHYDRSLGRAIENNRWQKHACFLEYIPCAVASSNFLSGDLRQQLAAEFGEKPGILLPGDTDWPANAPRHSAWNSAEALASLQLRESILTAYRAQVGA